MSTTMTVSEIGLEITAERTATWTKRFRVQPQDADVRAAIIADAPSFAIADPKSRAEYISGRFAQELTQPVAYSDEQRAEIKSLLFERGLAGALNLERLPTLLLESFRDGQPIMHTTAFQSSDGLPYVLVAEIVPVRWPHGATLVRGNFLERAITKTRSVEQRIGKPVAGTLVLSYFVEDEVADADCGLDVKLVVSAFPGRAEAAGVEPMPVLVHSELLPYATRVQLAARHGAGG